MARKVAILARECGMAVELGDVPVESLVPEPLRAVSSSAEYMQRLPDYDSEMAERLQQAEASGECLRWGLAWCSCCRGGLRCHGAQ